MDLLKLMPESERMRLEKIIDSQKLQIKKLKKKQAVVMTPNQWMERFGNCNNIQDTYDTMERFGYITKQRIKNEGN